MNEPPCISTCWGLMGWGTALLKRPSGVCSGGQQAKDKCQQHSLGDEQHPGL